MSIVRIVNMSIAACWLIPVVILVRFLLKKAPKRISCVLWAIVAVRLICPFSLESAVSLVPSSETIPEEIFFYEGTRQNASAWIDIVDNPAFSQSVSLPTGQTVSVVQTRFVLATPVWLAGITALLLYALASYIRLKRSVRASVPVRDNILACDEVKSPFILGIIRPLIYVPSSMADPTLEYVITHETAHIRRRDHLWKPLGFLILTVHWFNPLCWLAYALFCRDIEMACDERVIRDMDRSGIAGYSQALLDCSFPRRITAVCPLAFGEAGVKERVKSVLNYKKPAFWVIAAAAAACIAVAVCFLTDPKTTFKLEKLEIAHYRYSGSPHKTEVTVTDPQTLSAFSGLLNYDGRNWSTDITKLEPEEYFVLKINDDLKLHINLLREDAWYMDEMKNGQLIRETSADSALIDALMEMLPENSGSAEKWFDSLHGDEMVWDGMREIDLVEFPGVTFRAHSDRIEAVTGKKTVSLYTGMPVWSVYFCDLTGDGLPELCSSLSFGSGIVDNRIIIYDYAGGASYSLQDRGVTDYTLRQDESDGSLYVDKRACMTDEFISTGRLVFEDGCLQVLWQEMPAKSIGKRKSELHAAICIANGAFSAVQFGDAFSDGKTQTAAAP